MRWMMCLFHRKGEDSGDRWRVRMRKIDTGQNHDPPVGSTEGKIIFKGEDITRVSTRKAQGTEGEHADYIPGSVLFFKSAYDSY